MNEDVAALAARPGVAPWRIRLATLVESALVTRTIVAVILANAVIMGLETHEPLMANHADTIHLLDKICLGIFVVELTVKLVAYQGHFWRSGWRVFDFLVVAVALVPGAGPWAVLRSLRVLRVLRLLTVVPTLRRVVAAFLHAIPGLLGVIAVMGIVFYTGAVLATTLYAESQPVYFGDLGSSLYSLFQIMTLDSWFSGIVRPMVAEDPTAGPFFLVFVVVTSFTVLNLFIGIIVTAMQEMAIAEEAADKAKAARRVAHDSAAGVSAADVSAAGESRASVDAVAVGAPSSDPVVPARTNGTPTAEPGPAVSSDVDEIIARMERDLAALRELAARG